MTMSIDAMTEARESARALYAHLPPREACESAYADLAKLVAEVGDRDWTDEETEKFDLIELATFECEAAYYASMTPRERYEHERMIDVDVEILCREADIPYEPGNPFPLPEDDP